MKICWDNLEKLKYRPDRNQWQSIKNKNIFYVYVNSCMNCSKPFLKQNSNKGLFCSKKCSNIGKYNSMYNKHHTKEAKMKISKATKGKNNPSYKGGYSNKNIPRYNNYASQISYCESVRRNFKDENILEVKCAYCGKWYIPTLINICNRISTLNGIKGYSGENRLYCSNNCKQECPIYNQNKWPKGFKIATSREVQPQLRQMVFKRDDYKCIKCGSTKNLHCHHIEGIRWEPLESADIDKCMTVCKDCHIEIHKQKDCGYNDMKCNNLNN